MPPLDINDAERLKELIVDPVVTALRLEMRQAIRPLIDEFASLRRAQNAYASRIDGIDSRLAGVEKFKLKIAAVCSGIALVAGIGWRVAQERLTTWLRKH